MIAVGTYRTRVDAELAQSALAAAGIESLIAADDAGGAYPLDLDGGVRLVRDAPDVSARNQAIIAHLERMEHMLEHSQAAVASLKELLEGKDKTPMASDHELRHYAR